jgi:hypothetical protein
MTDLRTQALGNRGTPFTDRREEVATLRNEYSWEAPIIRTGDSKGGSYEESLRFINREGILRTILGPKRETNFLYNSEYAFFSNLMPGFFWGLDRGGVYTLDADAVFKRKEDGSLSAIIPAGSQIDLSDGRIAVIFKDPERKGVGHKLYIEDLPFFSRPSQERRSQLPYVTAADMSPAGYRSPRAIRKTSA